MPPLNDESPLNERSRSAPPSEQYPEKYDAVKYIVIKNIETSLNCLKAKHKETAFSSLSDDVAMSDA